jgi:methylenetetrahydrofolate--tRNA-(uracil-5-)-methyltransferase
MSDFIHIVGGGLAGSEAAWQLAEAGLRVRLSEMRGGGEMTPAHQTDGLAELVCSNSFRSDDAQSNAVGLLHAEMRALGSLIMRCADEHKVPAGSALAVDRDGFSAAVTSAVHAHPLIEVVRERVDGLPAGPAIIATGPLTAAPLAEAIAGVTGQGSLAFFDAIAPIVYHDSIDMDVAWMASRWDKQAEGSQGDYINCPMTKDQYLAFHAGLIAGEKTQFRQWEKDTPYFEGCMPIEVMAERGEDTLRYGPMKPVGLDDPRTGRWPYAVVQLRQDNKLGSLWNMVGFQTKLKHAEQVRLFRTIPGWRMPSSRGWAGCIATRSEFARAAGHEPAAQGGAAHPLRRPDHRMRRLCGERRGGPARRALLGGGAAGAPMEPPPATTALGALLGHITGGADAATYQPMNINFGLFPPVAGRTKKADRKRLYTDRARADLQLWQGAAA